MKVIYMVESELKPKVIVAINKIEAYEDEFGLSANEIYLQLKECAKKALQQHVNDEMYDNILWPYYYSFVCYVKGYCDAKGIKEDRFGFNEIEEERVRY